MKKIFTLAILSSTLFYSLLESAPFGYVTNADDNYVSIIDLSTNAITGKILVGKHPYGIVASSDGKYLYVAITTPSSVSVIETKTNQVVKKFNVSNPNFFLLAITPDGKKLWAPSYDRKKIDVISTEDGSYQTITTANNLRGGIAITPDGQKAILGDKSGNVLIYNAKTLESIATINVGGTPYFVAVTSDSNFAYITDAGQNQVVKVNLNDNTYQKISSVGPTNFLDGIALNPEGAYAYVCCYNNDSITRITLSNNIVEKSFADTGDRPSTLWITPDGKYAYVCNLDGDSLTKIDLSNGDVIDTISGFSWPYQMAVPSLPSSFLEVLRYSPVKYQR